MRVSGISTSMAQCLLVIFPAFRSVFPEFIFRVEQVTANPVRSFVSERVEVFDDADGIRDDDVEHHRPREVVSVADRLIERYRYP